MGVGRAVLAVILAMLAVDLVAHRTAHVVSVREAAVWSAVWVSLGLAFGGVVWWAYGAQAGGEYFAGYLIEKSLAVDNVFVFALIFTYFAWILYVFGAFLVFTGWKMFTHRHDEMDPSRNPVPASRAQVGAQHRRVRRAEVLGAAGR